MKIHHQPARAPGVPRGSIATLGAQRVTRVRASIEGLSRAADLAQAQVEELLQQLEQELAVFEAAITSLLGPAG
jgi:hypothetical protein